MRASGLLTELSLSPLEAADTAQLAEAVSGQRLPETDADLLHAATGGFPLYIIEAIRGTAEPAARRCRSVISRPCCANVWTRGPWRPGRWPVWRPRWARTSPSTCSPRRATSTPALVVAAVDELWRRRIVRVFGDGYDFSHDLLRETRLRGISPPKRWLLHRRIAQGLELLHAEDADGVAAQLAEQYARAGRPERAVAYYQRAADVAAGMFAHAEAIRLHEKALSIIARPAGRARPGRPRTRGAGGDGRAAQRQQGLLLARSAADAGAHGHARGVTGPQGLDRRRHDRAVGHAARARAHGRQPPDGHPGPGPGRPLLRPVRPGSFRRRRFGHPPGEARRGAASPGPGREDGRRCRLAQHRHPLRRARDGLGRARPLAARPG